MQIKVTLTESEIKGIRDLAAFQAKQRPELLTESAKIFMKLAKAIDAPAKVAKSAKALWQVIGRADLKAQLIPATIVQIAKEQIVAYWRMADGAKATSEQCAYCWKPLGNARLTIIGDGTRLDLAHKACAKPYLAAHGNWQTGRYLESSTTGPNLAWDSSKPAINPFVLPEIEQAEVVERAA